jgi:hypothetical protein
MSIEARPRPRVYSSYAGQPSSSWDGLGTLFRYRLFYSLVAAPILLVLSLCFGINPTGTTLTEKYAELQVGMDVEDVREIMEPPVRSRRWPVHRMSMFDNLPDQGPATLTWQENGRTLKLDFKDGELVAKSLKPQK